MPVGQGVGARLEVDEPDEDGGLALAAPAGITGAAVTVTTPAAAMPTATKATTLAAPTAALTRADTPDTNRFIAFPLLEQGSQG